MVQTLRSIFLLLSCLHLVAGLDPAVFTREAELVPGSIGPGLECWDLLPLLLETECAWPTVEDTVEVTLCSTSSDSGALIITSAAPFPGQVSKTRTASAVVVCCFKAQTLAETVDFAGRLSSPASGCRNSTSGSPLLFTPACHSSLPDDHIRTCAR